MFWWCHSKREMEESHRWRNLRHKTDWYLGIGLPNIQKPVGVKWISKKRRIVEWYNVRLVAKGYSKKYGVDYDELFALWLVLKQSDWLSPWQHKIDGRFTKWM